MKLVQAKVMRPGTNARVLGSDRELEVRCADTLCYCLTQHRLHGICSGRHDGVHFVLRDAERRGVTDNVALRHGPGYDAKFGHPGCNCRAYLSLGGEHAPRSAIFDKLDRTHQSLAADIAHVGVFGQSLREALLQGLPHPACLFDQSQVVDQFQIRHTGSRTDSGFEI